VYQNDRWLTFDTRMQAWSTGGMFEATEPIVHAVTRFSDDRLCYVTWNSGGFDSYLCIERRALNNLLDYVDDVVSQEAAVASTVTFVYWAAQLEGRQHWQQVTFHYDTGDFAWLSMPGEIGGDRISWQTNDNVTAIVDTGISPELARRIETPQIIRRCNMIRLTIQNSVPGYWGLVGLEVAYGAPSRFLRPSGTT
jgi:hypothetical protein